MLLDYRLKLGLSQSELAAALGTDQAWISRAESGRAPIRNPLMLERALRDVERERSG
jgi:transcriptional regulator with XRE-family HTH domain